MLGKVVRQLKQPKVSEITSKLRDAILENWREDNEGVEVTLAPKENTYDELWFYASSIHMLCPRMFALMCAKKKRFYGESFDAETLWRFGEGKAAHDLFQQDILTTLPREIFLGGWEYYDPYIDENKKPTDSFCLHRQWDRIVEKDRIIERSWGPQPDDDDDWKYRESKVRIPDYRIVVKLDGILAWPDDEAEVFELKTEHLRAMDLLNPKLGGKPRPKHVLQTQVAMWATGLEKARIVYSFKGTNSFKTSLIEHIVRRDEKIIDSIKETATECIEALEKTEETLKEASSILVDEKDEEQRKKYDEIINSVIPEKLPECTKRTAERAKYCQGLDLCIPSKRKKKKKNAD